MGRRAANARSDAVPSLAGTIYQSSNALLYAMRTRGYSAVAVAAAIETEVKVDSSEH